MRLSFVGALLLVVLVTFELVLLVCAEMTKSGANRRVQGLFLAGIILFNTILTIYIVFNHK